MQSKREIHLVQLIADDVAEHWDTFAPGIERGLPGFVGVPTHEVMNNILAGCLEGTLQMWVLRVTTEEETTLAGALITAILDNSVVGLRSMWIYGIAPYYYDRELWLEGLELLKRVAKRARCWQIQTFVRRKRMLEVMEDLGADLDTRAITWRIE